MVNLAMLNWDYVTSIVISFSIAASFMILYNRGRQLYSSKEDDKEPVIEAIVSEYSRRLKHIEDVVVGLRVRIDNLELRKKSSDIDTKHHTHYDTSHEMSQTQQADIASVPQEEHISPIVQRLTSADTKAILEDVQNGTMEYILKLLNERPRSSR